MFALDDFAFIRCHFDRRHLDLYIFDEYITKQTRNEDVYSKLYKELKKINNYELVTADSAEPKSIADFKAYGAFIRGAEKGADSVRYGIKWLQGLRNIYIDKRRCPNAFREFTNYEYATDKDGNFISAYPDEDNHCLTGDTIVDTVNGGIKIKDLVNVDNIQLYSYDTENNKTVIANAVNCRCTRENAEIIEIEFENGALIQCTADHLILTSNRGYVKADELTADDDVINVAEKGIKIKRIKKLKKRQNVYDLEVPKYHNFSVNGGFIVHNCIDATRYALEKYYKRRGN